MDKKTASTRRSPNRNHNYPNSHSPIRASQKYREGTRNVDIDEQEESNFESKVYSSSFRANRSSSIISDDSPGSVQIDEDDIEIIQSIPKIKLGGSNDAGYISSEDEGAEKSSRHRRSSELSAKIMDEMKSGRLAWSDKEALLKKTRHSFQGAAHHMPTPDSTLSANSTHKSLSPRSSIWTNGDPFQDDVYFIENKSAAFAKSKSDERVNKRK